MDADDMYVINLGRCMGELNRCMYVCRCVDEGGRCTDRQVCV